MGNNNHKHIGLIGAVSVGKGYLGYQICKAFGEDKVWKIVLGDLIEERKAQDNTFLEQHSGTVGKGRLLPYEVVTPMVEERYQQGIEAGYKIFLWDGYARDKRQAENLLKIWGIPGIIKESSYRIFALKASEATCKDRLNKAIASGRRSNRGDNHVFEDRYNLHNKNEPEVIETIKTYGGFVKPIDADEPLETVARNVLISCRQIAQFKNSTRFEVETPITTRTECPQESLVSA